MDNYLVAIYQSLEDSYNRENDRAQNLDNSLAHQITIIAGYITFMIIFIDPVISLTNKKIITISELKWLYILYSVYTAFSVIFIMIQISAYLRKNSRHVESIYHQIMRLNLSKKSDITNHIKNNIESLAYVVHCNRRLNFSRKRWVNNSWAIIISTGTTLFAFLGVYLYWKMF